VRAGGKNPSLVVGAGLVTMLVITGGLGPLLVHRDPLAINLALALAGPSPSHPLGCDGLGRDMMARLVYGGRLSLGVSVAVVAVSLAVGSLVGGMAALVGGRVDTIVMRLVDVVLAFPGFLLAIALAAILGPGLTDLVIALSAMGWTGYARLVRGEVLSIREREYVQAAVGLGAPRWRIMIRHLMPALSGPLAVQATFGLGGIIVAEASLSFLGLGVLPPAPSWGNMLEAGRAFMLVAPHITTVPGVAIGLSVLGFNLLGDGLAARNLRSF
jgi:peptide/nickel transport system permease protein